MSSGDDWSVFVTYKRYRPVENITSADNECAKGGEMFKVTKLDNHAGTKKLLGSLVRGVVGNAVNEQLKKDLTILVIDDSNTIRRSAEIFLKQSGYEVILAQDGFDALAKIAQYHPDLIFVDIIMPRLDGYQTCSLIKRNPRYQATPVIMLSSKDGLFDRAKGRMVGSDQYLNKPFTNETLINAIRHHVLNKAIVAKHAEGNLADVD